MRNADPSPVVARAVLKADKHGNKFWLSCNSNWLDQFPLENDLFIPTSAFEIGASVEVRGNLTKGIIEKMSK